MESTSSVGRWFTKDWEGKRHEAIYQYVRVLEDEDSERYARMAENEWLFSQEKALTNEHEWANPMLTWRYGPSATNLVEYNINAVVALVAKHRPRIVAVTDNADWSLQQQARQLSRWLEADFERMRVYEDVTDMFRDAAIFAFGALHPFDDNGVPEVETILPDEFIFDSREIRRGEPLQAHRRHCVDIDTVVELYAGKKVNGKEVTEEMIRDAAAGARKEWLWYRIAPDFHVFMVESVRRPTRRGMKNGRYSVVMDGLTLHDEVWEDDEFPWVFFHWSKPVSGPVGRGVADTLKPKQARLNRRGRAIGRNIDLCGNPRLFLKPGDKQLKDQLDNSDAPIHVTNTGSEYKYVVSPALSREVYEDYNRQIAEAELVTGISQNMASGTKPPGIESAVALRELAQREEGPFALQAQRLESVYVEIAKRVIKIQKQIAAEHGNRSVMWNDGNLARKIEWEDVDIDETMYVLKLQPASLMPRTPAGRVQLLIEMAQANVIDREQFVMLADLPDLQKQFDLLVSGRRNIERTIELLEDDRIPMPIPNNYQNLQLGLRMVQARLLDIEGMNAPERVKERFRMWITGAQNEQAKAIATASAQVGAVPAVPGDPTAIPAEGMPGSTPLGLGLAVDPKTSTPLNAPGGLPDAVQRLSANAMGLPPH